MFKKSGVRYDHYSRIFASQEAHGHFSLDLSKSKSSDFLSREHKLVISILGVKGSAVSLFSMQTFIMPPLHPNSIFCIDPQALPSVILEPKISISFPLKSKSAIFSQGKTVVITWLCHIKRKIWEV